MRQSALGGHKKKSEKRWRQHTWNNIQHSVHVPWNWRCRTWARGPSQRSRKRRATMLALLWTPIDGSMIWNVIRTKVHTKRRRTMAEKQKKIAWITGDVGIVKIWERTFIRNKRKSGNWTRQLTWNGGTCAAVQVGMKWNEISLATGNSSISTLSVWRQRD